MKLVDDVLGLVKFVTVSIVLFVIAILVVLLDFLLWSTVISSRLEYIIDLLYLILRISNRSR